MKRDLKKMFFALFTGCAFIFLAPFIIKTVSENKDNANESIQVPLAGMAVPMEKYESAVEKGTVDRDLMEEVASLLNKYPIKSVFETDEVLKSEAGHDEIKVARAEKDSDDNTSSPPNAVKGDSNEEDMTEDDKSNDTDKNTALISTEEKEKAEEKEKEKPQVSRSSVLLHYNNLGVVSEVNDYLNIREYNSPDAPVIGKITKNSGVDILEDMYDGWYHIQSGDVNGYVAAGFIITGEEAKAIAQEQAILMFTVDAEVLNVRRDKDINSDIISQLNVNERYDVVSMSDGWVETYMGVDENNNTIVGYVSEEYVHVGYFLQSAVFYPEAQILAEQAEKEALANQQLRQDIVNFAMQYLGGAYVWGGTTLGVGVDCSGFLQQVLSNFGIHISRVTYDQINDGPHIDASQMRPGDLIFYSNTGHVSMYIGNGQAIHAYNPAHGIIITSWDYSTPEAIVDVIGN